jgi:MFS family permease
MRLIVVSALLCGALTAVLVGFWLRDWELALMAAPIGIACGTVIGGFAATSEKAPPPAPRGPARSWASPPPARSFVIGLLLGSAFLGAAATVAVIWFWLRDLGFALVIAPVGASVAALIATVIAEVLDTRRGHPLKGRTDRRRPF